MLLRQRT